MTFTQLAAAAEELAAYTAASQLIHAISLNLATGRRHYRTTAGQLLTTLDGVVEAILTDTLETDTNGRDYSGYPRRVQLRAGTRRFDRTPLKSAYAARHGQPAAKGRRFTDYGELRVVR